MSSPATVMTIDGLMPLTDLEIYDLVKYEDNARTVVTVYRDKTGKIVKKDAWACILRPLPFTVEGGQIG